MRAKGDAGEASYFSVTRIQSRKSFPVIFHLIFDSSQQCPINFPNLKHQYTPKLGVADESQKLIDFVKEDFPLEGD